jgi:hypothetical protein
MLQGTIRTVLESSQRTQTDAPTLIASVEDTAPNLESGLTLMQ